MVEYYYGSLKTNILFIFSKILISFPISWSKYNIFALVNIIKDVFIEKS